MRRVYPRVCGGTRGGGRRLQGRSGLSPRVRGNRLLALFAMVEKGVYPRVCGGTCPCGTVPYLDEGLSPRVRGNQLTPVLILTDHGSIPACAGEPVPREVLYVADGVYPRVCGGTCPSRGPLRG